MFYKVLIIGFSVMLITACASFYETSIDFNKQFEQGNIDDAFEQLKVDKQYSRSNNKFLFYVNKGLLLSMKGKYEESNKVFEKAYLFGEDFKVNYMSEVASYFTNPMITVYRGEDHEHLMPLYYKALNFLKMGKYEEALVECKRLNIRLQQLSDKYKSPEKFQRDAFIHNLMGIIYQASKDWNNAFIAYRNAYDIYEEDYVRFFGMHAPDQLKRDVLTSAWHSGFDEEFNFYKEKFNWTDFTVSSTEAELLFFWHNGLSPVKQEVSVNFVVNHSSDNLVVFSNEEFPMVFSFPVTDKKERADLSDLEMLRITFPKYVERPAYFTSASIKSDTVTYPLELAEDVNKISFKCLQERMILEFSKSLIRAAIKKAAEQGVRSEDKRFGALVGVVNAITERADTRNWQTLPHSISYARIPMKEGLNEISFTMQTSNGESATNDFKYYVQKGQTYFHTFSALESRPGY